MEKPRKFDTSTVISIAAVVALAGSVWLNDTLIKMVAEKNRLIKELFKRTTTAQRTMEEQNETLKTTLGKAHTAQTELETARVLTRTAQENWRQCLVDWGKERNTNQREMRHARAQMARCTTGFQECTTIAELAHNRFKACTVAAENNEPFVAKTDLEKARLLQGRDPRELTEEQYEALYQLLDSTDPEIELILDAHPAIFEHHKEALRRRILNRIFKKLQDYLQEREHDAQITIQSDVNSVPYHSGRVGYNNASATIYVRGEKTPIWLSIKFDRRRSYLSFGNQTLLTFQPLHAEHDMLRDARHGTINIDGIGIPVDVVVKLNELLEMWKANNELSRIP